VSWGLPTALATEEKPTSRRRLTKQTRAAATSSPLHFLYPGLTSTHTSPASSPSHTHTPLPARYGQPTALTTPSASSTRRASRNEAKAAAAAARRSSDLARLLDPAYLPAAARRQLETAQYAGQQGVYVDDDGEMHDPDWKHFPVLPPGMGVNSENRRGRPGLGMVKDGRQSSTGSASGYARSGAYGSSLYSSGRRGTSPTARGARRPTFDWELAVDEEALADEYPEDEVLAEELSMRLREEQRAKERREKEAKEREERRRSLGDAPGSPGGRKEDNSRGYGGSGRKSWEDPGPMRVPSPMNDVLLLGPAQPRRATPVSAAAPKAPVPNTIAYQQPGLGRHPVTKVTSSRGVARTRTREGSFSTAAATSWESAAPVMDTDAPVVGGVYVIGGARDAEKEAEKEKDAAEAKEKEGKECVTTRIAKKARRFSWGSSKKDEKTLSTWSPQTPSTPLSPASPLSPTSAASAFSQSSGYSYSYSPSPYIDEEDEDRDQDVEAEEEERRTPAYAPSCGQSLRRQWQALALSVRFGVFRAQRRVMRRVHSIL
jgi:hypothetical protein